MFLEKLTNKSWFRRIAFVVLIVLLGMYIRYRLIPVKIYPLSPSTTSRMDIDRQKDSISLHVYQALEDTIIYQTYLIDGYLGSDTSSIKKAILSFLKLMPPTKVQCYKNDFKYPNSAQIDSAEISLSRKTVKYYFSFYKSSWGLDKNYVETDPEYDNLGKFSDQIIANVQWEYGKLSSITFLKNGLITYSEYYVRRSGNWVRVKFKDGVEISQDEYTPNGIIHEDLSEEWKESMKQRR